MICSLLLQKLNRNFLNRKQALFIDSIRFTFLFSFLFITTLLTAQQDTAAYRKAITERSAKIVNTLSITDSVLYNKTVQVLVSQYNALSRIQDENKTAVDQIKKDSLAAADNRAARLKQEEDRKAALVLQQHNSFVALLQKLIRPEQLELVKDGMTYGVFPKTYNAYLEMIPSLTAEQKVKIYDWLKEARELAMDGESSDKKHAIFGKYKGRINNYLSAQGYDVKKEGEEWAKRIEAKKKANQGQN